MTDRDLDMEAAEFALGSLSGAQRDALTAERTHNAALDAAIVAWEARLAPLSAAIPARTPPKGLWDKIDAALDALPDPRLTRTRNGDGIWVTLLDGVTIKVLSNNTDGTQTYLLKLAAGARVPAHRHPHAEECYVVAGTMTFGGETYSQGDYVGFPAGVAHKEVFSPSGGTILIRGGFA